MADPRGAEIAKLEALFSENPDGRVFTHLAEAYRRAGEPERARMLLEAGLSRHGDYASAHVVHGRVLLDLGQEAEAEAAFRRVLGLDPENLVALRALGDLSRRAGRTAEALGYYEQLHTRDPSSAELDAIIRELGEALTRAPAAESPEDALPADPGFGPGAAPEAVEESARTAEEPERLEQEPRGEDERDALLAGAGEAPGGQEDGSGVEDAELRHEDGDAAGLASVEGPAAAMEQMAAERMAADSAAAGPPADALAEDGEASPADAAGTESGAPPVVEAPTQAPETMMEVASPASPAAEAPAGEEPAGEEPAEGDAVAGGGEPGEGAAAPDGAADAALEEELDIEIGALTDLPAGSHSLLFDDEYTDGGSGAPLEAWAPLTGGETKAPAGGDAAAAVVDAGPEAADPSGAEEAGVEAPEQEADGVAAAAQETGGMEASAHDADAHDAEEAVADAHDADEAVADAYHGGVVDVNAADVDAADAGAADVNAAVDAYQADEADAGEADAHETGADEVRVDEPVAGQGETPAGMAAPDAVGAGAAAWTAGPVEPEDPGAPEDGGGADAEADAAAARAVEPGAMDLAAEGAAQESGGSEDEPDEAASVPAAMDQGAAAAAAVVEGQGKGGEGQGGETLGGEVVTETLAELYLAQGLVERAVTLYRQLLAARPDEVRLETRLREAEARLAGAPPGKEGGSGWEVVDAAAGGAAPEADRLEEVEAVWTGGAGTEAAEVSPYAWPEEDEAEAGTVADEATIGQYLKGLLSWKPNAPAEPDSPTHEQAESGAQELQPDGTASSTEPASGERETGDDDDLEMFRAWLQSLKR